MSARKQSGGNLFVLLWPFWALWAMVTTLIKVVGRMMMLGTGLLLMIVGMLLTITIVGAVIGVPLVLFGLLLVARSLF